MIINKFTKKFFTCSDKKNENWLKDENFYVVDDNSELATKIINLYPFFDFIEKDGILIDVVEDTTAREKSLNKENMFSRIYELKRKLSDTDYQAIKYAEGQISEEEYAPIKQQRQAWRDRINELEASLEVQNG